MVHTTGITHTTILLCGTLSYDNGGNKTTKLVCITSKRIPRQLCVMERIIELYRYHILIKAQSKF